MLKLVAKYLSDTFPIQNGFITEFFILRLELNGTHLFLVYTDDDNLLGENINTVKGHMKLFYMLVSMMI
jgi:hypothetical protein